MTVARKHRFAFVRGLGLTVALTAAVIGIGVGVGGSSDHVAEATEATATLAAGRSAIYVGGPAYSGGNATIDTLRSSGFTTVVLWTIHVQRNGNLVFNDIPIVSDGRYIGDPDWPARVRALKRAPTSVSRVEVGVGSWGVDDWGVIRDLINTHGTGSDSILYRNLRALLDVTGADAINDDDETRYDLNSTVRFARMTLAMGYKSFAIAPYTNMSFWARVKSDLGASLDQAHLQVYAGGAGNDPVAWNRALGMTVDPGMWSKNGAGCANGDSPSKVQSTMSAWRSSAGIQGGFIWLFDDILKCSGHGSAADYAAAINNAVGGQNQKQKTRRPTAGVR